MARFLAGLALALVPVVAAAQTAAPESSCPTCLTYYRTSSGRTNLLDNVGLDIDVSGRSIFLNSADYDQLHIVIFYTYATATEIFVQLSCSPDGTEYIPRPVDALLSGGTNQRFLLSYDVTGCKSTKVVFGASDDSGGDSVTVQAVGQSSFVNGVRQTPPAVQ